MKRKKRRGKNCNQSIGESYRSYSSCRKPLEWNYISKSPVLGSILGDLIFLLLVMADDILSITRNFIIS
jgi:hypothetical protein